MVLSFCKQYEVFQLKLSTHSHTGSWRTKTSLVFKFYVLPTSVLDSSDSALKADDRGGSRTREKSNRHYLLWHCLPGTGRVGTGDRETNARVLLMDYDLHGEQNKKWCFKDLGGRKWSNGRLGKMGQSKREKPIYLTWKTAQSNGCGMINSAVLVWLRTLGPKNLTWFGRKALADVNSML